MASTPRGKKTTKKSPRLAPAPTDWRTDTLARLRAIITAADPAITEEAKWRKPGNAMRGVPVWSCNGMICTGETYKNAVKLTFARGASLPDPAGLFNASLDGNTRRAIDIREGDTINNKALTALVRAAIDLNNARKPPAAKPASKNAAVRNSSPRTSANKPATRPAPQPAPKPAKSTRPPMGTAATTATEYIASIDGWRRTLAESLRNNVRKTADLEEVIKWGHIDYFHNGPLLLIRVEEHRVLFGFWRGKQLVHIDPRLKPGGKYELATMDLREGDTVAPATIARLVSEAVRLNTSIGNPSSTVKPAPKRAPKPRQEPAASARGRTPRSATR